SDVCSSDLVRDGAALRDREHRGGPSAAHDAGDPEHGEEVRAGGAVAREAVRGGERERQAPELVVRHRGGELPGSGGEPAREPAVPLLRDGGDPGGGAAPGPGAV